MPSKALDSLSHVLRPPKLLVRVRVRVSARLRLCEGVCVGPVSVCMRAFMFVYVRARVRVCVLSI